MSGKDTHVRGVRVLGPTEFVHTHTLSDDWMLSAHAGILLLMAIRSISCPANIHCTKRSDSCPTPICIQYLFAKTLYPTHINIHSNHTVCMYIQYICVTGIPSAPKAFLATPSSKWASWLRSRVIAASHNSIASCIARKVSFVMAYIPEEAVERQGKIRIEYLETICRKLLMNSNYLLYCL